MMTSSDLHNQVSGGRHEARHMVQSGSGHGGTSDPLYSTKAGSPSTSVGATMDLGDQACTIVSAGDDP